MFEALDPDADEAALVARIAELERVKSAAAAEQAKATAAFAHLRRGCEEAAGIPGRLRGRGLAGEVALARHDSPHRGNRHLGFAETLVHEMPLTLAALETGALSEWRATLIVRESACLTLEDRRALDAELCADPTALAGKGDTRIAADAKAIAYRLDPQAVVNRAVTAAEERRVTCRPAPDAMTYLTAHLPLAQGVAVHAALHRAADTTADGRTRGQVMADTLVERITGRPAQSPVPVTVDLVITDETLFGGDPEPARIAGHGPVPAAVARHLVTDAVGDDRSRALLRRLYRRPDTGALVAMESRARRFPKALATFIALRDDTCRTPYCDAPIRHTDHADPHVTGGPTTADNGQGLCVACNHAKQAPGWHARPHRHTGQRGCHTVELTTPTGATYTSKAPPPPGHPSTATTIVDIVRFRIALRAA